MPQIHDQDNPVFAGAVPHFMFVEIVEHDRAALLPLPCLLSDTHRTVPGWNLQAQMAPHAHVGDTAMRMYAGAGAHARKANHPGKTAHRLLLFDYPGGYRTKRAVLLSSLRTFFREGRWLCLAAEASALAGNNPLRTARSLLSTVIGPYIRPALNRYRWRRDRGQGIAAFIPARRLS